MYHLPRTTDDDDDDDDDDILASNVRLCQTVPLRMAFIIRWNMLHMQSYTLKQQMCN